MFDFLPSTLTSLGRKYIMALTGLCLAAFLVFHAVGNSFIFRGNAALNAYAEQLHSWGMLITIAEFLLLIIFLIHIVVGISLVKKNQKTSGSRYAVSNSAGGATWGSRTMPWTGLVLSTFLMLHLVNVRFVDQALPIAEVVEQTLSYPLYTLIYFFGLTSLFLHISHGFWSLVQTWGLYHPQYNNLTRALTSLLAILVSMVFFGVVLLVWSRNYIHLLP